MGGQSGSKFREFLERAYGWSIPPYLRPAPGPGDGQAESLRKARLTVFFSLAVGPWGPVTGAVYVFVMYQPTVAAIATVAGALVSLAPWLLRRTGSARVAGNYFAGVLFATVVSIAWINGLGGGVTLTWLPMIPLTATCLADRRSGFRWVLASVAAIAAFWAAARGGWLAPVPFGRQVETALLAIAVGGLIVVTGSFAVIFEQVKDTALGELQASRLELQAKRRLAEEALQELRAAQAHLVESRKMAALGTMAGGLAHEINNPLAIIQLGVSLLGGASPRAGAERVIPEIHSAVRRIADVVRVLGKIAEDSSGAGQEKVELRSLLDASLGMASPMFDEAGQELVVDPGSWPEGEIRCQPADLAHALLNLFRNALDASRDTRARVWLDASREGDAFVIGVSDDGHGVPPEAREKIFDPFFTTRNVGQGAGLGLAITRSIVEKHGGTVRLGSSPSRVTRFEMRIPAAAAGTA